MFDNLWPPSPISHFAKYSATLCPLNVPLASCVLPYGNSEAEIYILPWEIASPRNIHHSHNDLGHACQPHQGSVETTCLLPQISYNSKTCPLPQISSDFSRPPKAILQQPPSDWCPRLNKSDREIAMEILAGDAILMGKGKNLAVILQPTSNPTASAQKWQLSTYLIHTHISKNKGLDQKLKFDICNYIHLCYSEDIVLPLK